MIPEPSLRHEGVWLAKVFVGEAGRVVGVEHHVGARRDLIVGNKIIKDAG